MASLIRTVVLLALSSLIKTLRKVYLKLGLIHVSAQLQFLTINCPEDAIKRIRLETDSRRIASEIKFLECGENGEGQDTWQGVDDQLC